MCNLAFETETAVADSLRSEILGLQQSSRDRLNEEQR